MVGDGLNDAPALAAAHVSLSPISAADLTQAQADAVFLGDRLEPVLNTIEIAHRAHRLMRQNLGIALVYNLIAVPLAFLGFVTPLVAALAMSGSSSHRNPQCPPGPRSRPSASAGDAVFAIPPRLHKEPDLMEVLIYLVPMALLLGLSGLAAFLWSLKNGQYDDVQGAAVRVLSDDDMRK